MTCIPTSDLRVGMYIQKLGGSWFSHPFLRTSFLLTDEKDLRAIVDAGVAEVWIDVARSIQTAFLFEDTETGGAALRQTTNEMGPVTSPAEQIVPNPRGFDAPSRGSVRATFGAELDRASKLCHCALDEMRNVFGEARLGKTIDFKETLPLVGEIAASVERHPTALLSLVRLKTHDDYTYLHSVAVCTMMVALSRQLGMSEDLFLLAGHGGLMHDIGKAMMPLDVLNKPGRLTDEEFGLIKSHPHAGAGLLASVDAPDEVQSVALHHHEKMDGAGYPHQLAGDQIPLLARMGAVCDVYDAVTSNRAYKSAWEPAHAIRQMAAWKGHFDQRILHAFIKTVGIYPVGSLVRLASKRLAVVVESNPQALLSPKVRAFYSLRANEPVPLETIDLSIARCSESIVGPEDARQWGFDRLDDIWLNHSA